MKIESFSGKKIHNNLDIDISPFNKDLNFLVGPNGSGKTTVLRLIMSLITPSVEELLRIDFEEISLTLAIDHSRITIISAHKNSTTITIKISGEKEIFRIPIKEFESYINSTRMNEGIRQISNHPTIEHPVLTKIQKLSTPMFLGLDRRLYFNQEIIDLEEQRRRDFLIRKRNQTTEPNATQSLQGASLIDALNLIQDTMNEIKINQQNHDKNLRQQLMKSSIKYKSITMNDFSSLLTHNKKSIDLYKQKISKLEKVAQFLQLPSDEIRATLDDLGSNLEKMSIELNSKRHNDQFTLPPDILLPWIINKNQLDKIIENLSKFEEYENKINQLYEPINRLVSILNTFFAQTNKQITLLPSGQLTITMHNHSQNITALSSGERQLFVILTHLILNKNLAQSGIFIVDEPELSLHISWQEIFVKSVQKANPEVQLIFATHSPAIILKNNLNCLYI